MRLPSWLRRPAGTPPSSCGWWRKPPPRGSPAIRQHRRGAGERAAPKGPGGEAKNEDAGNGVTIVPIEQSEALALKLPTLTQMKIPPGTLSGRPELPDEEVETVAVSYRLMARSDLDRGPLSKLTQYLFQMRSRIAQTE